jgi:hypothetical protein
MEIGFEESGCEIQCEEGKRGCAGVQLYLSWIHVKPTRENEKTQHRTSPKREKGKKERDRVVKEKCGREEDRADGRAM